jgi:hypothetical protein
MKKIFVFVPIIFCIVLLVSCATGSGTTADPAPGGTSVNLDEARARAASARDNALSIKAEVAAKADFDNASTVFNGANSVEAFLEAERLFTGAYNTAKTLRDAALSELEKARSEIKNAEDEAAAYESERAANEAAEGAM